MIPCITLTEEPEDLEAQHMVCSYLVHACRQAMYELALEEQGGPDVRHRAVQVLKVVHQDWLEAQREIAREMRTKSMPPGLASTPTDKVADARKSGPV
jgi:hypothetical protein